MFELQAHYIPSTCMNSGNDVIIYLDLCKCLHISATLFCQSLRSFLLLIGLNILIGPYTGSVSILLIISQDSGITNELCWNIGAIFLPTKAVGVGISSFAKK